MEIKKRNRRPSYHMLPSGKGGGRNTKSILGRIIDSKIVFSVAIIFTVHYITWNMYITDVVNPPSQIIYDQDTEKPIDALRTMRNNTGSTKLILAWTPLTKRKPLWGIKEGSFAKCSYQNCEVTGNRSLLADADLLLFRLRELKSNVLGGHIRQNLRMYDLSDMPSQHKYDQIWMEVNEESPIYSHSDEELAPLDEAFNLSISYMQQSDYPLSLIPEVRRKRKPLYPERPVNFAREKTKMALWFESHCNASSGRDQYVKELQKYITVDVIGKCSKNSDVCPLNSKTCVNSIRHKYKFYLAFENSICKDYITEKFWGTLVSSDYNNIPIALGSSLHQYETLTPPHSYLHTRNFTSIKALANFMHTLDKNDTLFNFYHQWRYTHDLIPRQYPSGSFQCYMCEKANLKREGKREHKTLSKQWSRKKYCDLNPEPTK